MFEAGDAVTGKIGGLKIYSQPNKTSKVVFTIARGEDVIYTGKGQGAFMHVQGQNGEGWVEKMMMRK